MADRPTQLLSSIFPSFSSPLSTNIRTAHILPGGPLAWPAGVNNTTCAGAGHKVFCSFSSVATLLCEKRVGYLLFTRRSEQIEMNRGLSACSSGDYVVDCRLSCFAFVNYRSGNDFT